jgi:dolichyl-phosphate beta-glucosyltransferase
MEKISVILPIYNESECLDNIFDSVLEFSRNNPYYRFIFVNDGSTEGN